MNTYQAIIDLGGQHGGDREFSSPGIRTACATAFAWAARGEWSESDGETVTLRIKNLANADDYAEISCRVVSGTLHKIKE